MFNLRSLKFCLLALLMVLVCIVASPSVATVWIADSSLQQSQSAPLAQPAEQQGRSHYAAGQFAEAAASFQQAAQAYQAQGDELKQAIALSNLALANQQLGQWEAASQAITQSLSLLETGGDTPDRRLALAEALDIQSALSLAQGKAEAAFDTGERAAKLYEQLGDRDRATESRIAQAQALQTLGLYRRAIATVVAALDWQPQTLTQLKTLTTQLQILPNSPTAIAALQSLGEALRVTGNLETARAVLQRSLEMAQQIPQPEAIATTQFRLANLTWSEALLNLSRDNLTRLKAIELVRQAQQGDRRIGIDPAEKFYRTSAEALELYRQAAAATTSAKTRLQAQLNQLRVAVETDRSSADLLPQVQQEIDRLPPGHAAIEARINLARTLINASAPQPQAAQILAIAIQQARDLQDPHVESNALGLLGKLYEQTGQLSEAEQVTQKALFLVQSDITSDLTYHWQWQLGRLLKAKAEAKDPSHPVYTEAIASYKDAVNTLKSIRDSLIATTPDEQLSFQTAIEPIYRQLVSLLLQSQSNIPDDQSLRTARDTVDLLQLAELDNFFREICLNGSQTSIDQIDQTAAIFYPIILPDRLAVIVSLPPQDTSQSASDSDSPQRPLTYYSTVVSQTEVEATVSLLRDSLDQDNDKRFLPPAQQLYDWLLRPIQARLKAAPVKTLVFVLDGVLRNIPMSVLHDGQQYLVEQPYGIALTLGLQLLEAQPLAPSQLKSALLAGVSEARPGFSALPNVRDELAQIQTEIPNSTTLLDRGADSENRELRVNGGFTNANFQAAIETTSYPIVHLATHGQFSSQIVDTYILTEDSRLNIDDLRASLQATAVRKNGMLDLLVLSACSTATGDDRAALGLAGMAIRAGARSTVATLWQVNDYSSAVFMGEFYRQLATVKTAQISKAEALHQAQRSLLQHPDYQHPYFWAPYVLIGNWQ